MRAVLPILLLATLFLPACADAPGSGGGSTSYDATVTRTKYGIPHIQAQDFASLGYGYGYAFAEDNLCTLLEDLVTIRGERSKYFGPDGTYTIPAVPVTANNVDSDFFWKLVADDRALASFKAGADPDLERLTRGYADGFNRYIRELKAGEHPGRQAACADAPWLTEISEDDLFRRFIRLAVIASSSVFTTEIATTQPPGAAAANAAEEIPARQVDPADEPFARLKRRKLGSNMYALGPDATQSGTPIVYGNPHFPWTGTERLYLTHLTIPGTLDVEGVSLYGVPLVLIGFDDQVAWSHTVSTAYRFGLFQLTLNPDNPTQYVVDGQTKDMEAVPLSIEVQNPDGSTSTRSRTLYRSQYGPLIEISSGGTKVLSWGRTTAFALRDANLENNRLIEQYFRWNQAKSFDEFKALHRSVLGVPWVNTVASGPDGDAYYGDISVVPNVSDAKAAACSTPVGQFLAAIVPGLPLLDGSRSECNWDSDPDAPAPGIFGPSHLPTLERRDWVANMNDSYWLTNPAQPVTGYARIIGDEGTARTLRTRLGILQVQRRLAGTDGLAGTRFDLPSLQEVALSAHVYSGELAQPAIVSGLCSGTEDAGISAACNAIVQWDTSASLTSIGMPLWQEFWHALNQRSSSYWRTPFNVADPVNTPRDLDVTLPAVHDALDAAEQKLQSVGISPDAVFEDVQHSGVNDTTIPIFGAEGGIGAFTVAEGDGLTRDGYRVSYGNSYIQTVTWEGGRVHAEGFLTYSESTDPASPHFADFTRAYSQKQWHRFPFHDDEVKAASESETHLQGSAR